MSVHAETMDRIRWNLFTIAFAKRKLRFIDRIDQIEPMTDTVRVLSAAIQVVSNRLEKRIDSEEYPTEWVVACTGVEVRRLRAIKALKRRYSPADDAREHYLRMIHLSNESIKELGQWV